VPSVDLTDSWQRTFPGPLCDRYQVLETRNAAAILAATNPARFGDLVAVLDRFVLTSDDLTTPGGSESNLAARLNTAFRGQGWRESRVDTVIKLSLVKKRYAAAGETRDETVETQVTNEGYLVDNVADRVALDVEWNAKDGNLDRDLGAYRALYDAGLIDLAVMITRTHADLRQLAYRLARAAGRPHEAANRLLGTTTTTNTTKLLPRLQRGDGGGCPILVIAICASTWAADAPGPLRLPGPATQ
jgi:hypothetical protein